MPSASERMAKLGNAERLNQQDAERCGCSRVTVHTTLGIGQVFRACKARREATFGRSTRQRCTPRAPDRTQCRSRFTKLNPASFVDLAGLTRGTFQVLDPYSPNTSHIQYASITVARRKRTSIRVSPPIPGGFYTITPRHPEYRLPRANRLDHGHIRLRLASSPGLAALRPGATCCCPPANRGFALSALHIAAVSHASWATIVSSCAASYAMASRARPMWCACARHRERTVSRILSLTQHSHSFSTSPAGRSSTSLCRRYGHHLSRRGGWRADTRPSGYKVVTLRSCAAYAHILQGLRFSSSSRARTTRRGVQYISRHVW
jgi:hypothetical protein